MTEPMNNSTTATAATSTSTSPPTSTSTTSKLLRMRPHPLSSIPKHPILEQRISSTTSSTSENHPDLATFLQKILTEAVTFADEYLPRNFTSKSTTKSSPPSSSKVELLSHTTTNATPLNSGGGGGGGGSGQETWFARRSLHTPIAQHGSASYEEFDAGLRGPNHSQREKEYTPDLVDARQICEWSAEDIVTSSSSPSTSSPSSMSTLEEAGFSDPTLQIYEMCHRIPSPLMPRVFAVVVATAKTKHPHQESFVVAQIPVDLSDVEAAWYSNGKSSAAAAKQKKGKDANIAPGVGSEGNGGTVAGVTDVVMGTYTSIERVHYVPSTAPASVTTPPTPSTAPNTTSTSPSETTGVAAQSNGEQADSKIQWIMATASDAAGNLPMWMQKLGTPGAVVKDVGLFMKWAEDRRR